MVRQAIDSTGEHHHCRQQEANCNNDTRCPLLLWNLSRCRDVCRNATQRCKTKKVRSRASKARANSAELLDTSEHTIAAIPRTRITAIAIQKKLLEPVDATSQGFLRRT